MDSLPQDHFLKIHQFTPHNRQDIYPTIDPSNPANSLAGKVAVVTGASRGLGGWGLAPAFAKAGVRGLVLVATAVEKLKAVKASLKEAHPQLETLVAAADISSADAVKALFEQVRAKFGHADILVNAAGVLLAQGTIHEADPVDWWRNYEINAYGHFLLCHHFIQSLPSPASTPATIIGVTTAMAYGVWPANTGYGLSKLVSLQLNAWLAAEYPNITAQTLNPGLVDTDMLLPALRRFHIDTPEFVSAVGVWLASDGAKFLNGRIMFANWDADELVQKKDEILEKDLLKMKLGATLGSEQFQ